MSFTERINQWCVSCIYWLLGDDETPALIARIRQWMISQGGRVVTWACGLWGTR